MALWRIFGIELRRSGGWLVLGLMVVAALVTDLRFVIWDTSREGTGAPTWFRITAVGTVITGTYPLVAAYGAWLGSRPARANTQELEGLPRRWGVGSATPTSLSLWFWTGLATAIVYLSAATYTLLRARHVAEALPAGSVPWQSALVIIAAMIAVASIGFLIGRVWANLFVPVLAAAVVFFLFQIRDMTVSQYEGTHWLDAIIPTRLTYAMAPFIGDRVYPALFWNSLLWFVCITLFCFSALGLWRVKRIIPTIAMILIVMLAGWSGMRTMETYENASSWHAANRGVVCIEYINSQFCAPPGAMPESELQFIANQYESRIPVWFPAEMIPKRFSVVIAGEPPAPGSTPLTNFTSSTMDRGDVSLDALVTLIGGTSTQETPAYASQLVVACAMLLDSGKDCGASYPDDTFQRVPNASQSVEGQAVFAPFLESGEQPTEEEQQEMTVETEELQALTQKKLDNFMALSDEDKSTWLEENWDRLSSGDLPIDEMP